MRSIIIIMIVMISSINAQVNESNQKQNEKASIMENQYINEIIFIIVIILMTINYFKGKNTNKQMSNSIIERTFESVIRNFEYIGVNHESTSEMTRDHIGSYITCQEEESCNSFRLYMTGRRNIQFGILNIQLMKRHDLIYTNLISLVFPEKDQIVFEIGLERQDSSKGILYMIKSTNFKRTIDDYIDLKTFGLKISMDSIVQKSLLIFGESSETIECFFDKPFSSLINNHGDLIDLIQVTDCIASDFNKGGVNAKITFNLGKKDNKDYSNIGLLIGEFINALDRYFDFEPKNKLKETFSENRKKLAQVREKIKKNESGEQPLTFEEKYAKMTPAEKKKADEKEAKRAKNKGKITKLVKG